MYFKIPHDDNKDESHDKFLFKDFQFTCVFRTDTTFVTSLKI
jgi:hypothetical protein